MAVETPDYEVLRHEGSFQLRRYAGYLTANVRVTASDYARAMSAGFNPLADFIFGGNDAADRISMTAPVTAGRACCQKIPMTVPVTARQSQDEYVVSFTMPSSYSLETLPRPRSEAVSIESVESHLAAVARFGGAFSGAKAAQTQAGLESWIESQGLVAVGEPVVAQYDPPWKPGFARRNEIMIVVEANDANGAQGPHAPVPFVVSHPCPECEGRGNVDEQACNRCQGTGVERFFHGTKARLQPGDLIEPGRNANFGEPGRTANYVYMSGTLDAATWGAELALGEGRGRIYIVEPTGPIEDDPNLTNKRYPGNPTKSFRSREPLLVIGEITDWQGHSDEQVKAMNDGLAQLDRDGANIIDD